MKTIRQSLKLKGKLDGNILLSLMAASGLPWTEPGAIYRRLSKYITFLESAQAYGITGSTATSERTTPLNREGVVVKITDRSIAYFLIDAVARWIR